MRKRVVSFVLVACLTGVLVTSTAPAFALSDVEACFFNSLNAERAERGRPKLVLKSDLTTVARRHSGRMADDGTIYHNQNLRNEVDGNWWALGENVGMGPTCKAIHDAFMASPGHKANILDTDYNQVGVGVEIKDDTVYVTEVFAGRPSGTSQPRPKTNPKPKPNAVPDPPTPRSTRPPPLEAAPRILPMLLMLIGMDAPRVDPTTGAALGI